MKRSSSAGGTPGGWPGRRSTIGGISGPLVRVVDPDPERRVLDDARRPVDHPHELAGRAPAGAPAGLDADVADDVLALLGDEEVERSRSRGTWSYQISSSPIGGGAAHRQAVGLAHGHRGLGAGAVGRPISRASTTRLAARRCTSHSKGPGRVSSKSRRSKDRFRSGVAQRPKFRTWASPHSWTSSPECSAVARSAAITAAAPAVVGPR